MYLTPETPWKPTHEYVECAKTWADMFARGGTATEKDPAADYALDLYSLAYLFWEVGTFLANRNDLTDDDRRTLSASITEAQTAFEARFPTLFPQEKVREGFDALRFLVCVKLSEGCAPSRLFGRTRSKAWVAATWMRNALHNEYLASKA